MYIKKLCNKRLFYMKLENEFAKKRRVIEKEIVLYYVTKKEKDYAQLRLDKTT